ncbi:hypothetical protein OPKNFCMD_3608 [Methylobacterium crusticola]|uniref:Uncharacterized protein n=1 Tax=Methylobacterium crusticola TaxID=1697972 RepID=A0ABQ4R1M2_9HYPH|nr:hypothetical protein OPKNFCMD_3608 [Methylobacterium crusticola]
MTPPRPAARAGTVPPPATGTARPPTHPVVPPDRAAGARVRNEAGARAGPVGPGPGAMPEPCRIRTPA